MPRLETIFKNDSRLQMVSPTRNARFTTTGNKEKEKTSYSIIEGIKWPGNRGPEAKITSTRQIDARVCENQMK